MSCSSPGMVVIGDPQAETVAKVRFTGGHVSLTPNTHYLQSHTGGSIDRRKKPHPHKHTPSPLKPTLPMLPSVSVTVGGASISTTKAMYSGNASQDHSQKRQTRVKVSDIKAGTVDAQTVEGLYEGAGDAEQFLHVPVLEMNTHSKTMGEERKDSSYFQVDLDEVSCTVSLLQIAKLFFISASWKATTLPHVQTKFSPPPSVTEGNLGHLHVHLRHTTLTQSTTERHSLLSVVAGECNGGIVKDSDAERRQSCIIPVLHGPLDTRQWNTAGIYGRAQVGVAPSCQPSGHERVLELFIATAAQHCKGVSRLSNCSPSLHFKAISIKNHGRLGVLSNFAKK